MCLKNNGLSIDGKYHIKSEDAVASFKAHFHDVYHISAAAQTAPLPSELEK